MSIDFAVILSLSTSSNDICWCLQPSVSLSLSLLRFNLKPYYLIKFSKAQVLVSFQWFVTISTGVVVVVYVVVVVAVVVVVYLLPTRRYHCQFVDATANSRVPLQTCGCHCQHAEVNSASDCLSIAPVVLSRFLSVDYSKMHLDSACGELVASIFHNFLNNSSTRRATIMKFCMKVDQIILYRLVVISFQ